MFVAHFGSTQSASFECLFENNGEDVAGTTYRCKVQNSVNITTFNAAQVDSITGTHLAGFNNDNVEDFDADDKGQINYFPRGINKFFKNLKSITIANSGLKEIHQSDLKDFPKLVGLWLNGNNLEIIEENLFEFNPNLKAIILGSNQISHIDPKVFNKLIKFDSLYLTTNPCINMEATNDPTSVQNIIKTAQASCTNFDYSSLEQKVKYLEMESRILNSADLNEKLENLENEIKNSRFANFFQEKIEDLNAVAIQKEREDVVDSKLTKIEEMVANISTGNGMSNKNNIIVNIS